MADLPRQLALLWRTAEPGRRGPRPGLTLDRIASVAIELADTEGLAALSMARVAEHLGVTTMALYRYVAAKDDLLALMSDVAIGAPAADHASTGTTLRPEPTSGGAREVPVWRRRLEDWSRDQLTLARLHPWVLQTTAGIPALGPHRVAWIERGLAALDGTPLTAQQRTDVVGRLALHVLSEGRVVAEIELALADGAFDDQGADYDFGFGLDLVLDGVEALIAPHTGSPAGPTTGRTRDPPLPRGR